MSSSRDGSAIVPPATLGLLGGGQLGRMTALSARSAGYHVYALDPDPQCAIGPLAEDFIAAGWADVDAAARLARDSDVVTFEIEKISVASLEAASQFAPVRPGPEVLHQVVEQDRQKHQRVIAERVGSDYHSGSVVVHSQAKDQRCLPFLVET